MEEFAESCENDEADAGVHRPDAEGSRTVVNAHSEIGSQATKNPEAVWRRRLWDYMRGAGHTVFAFWFAEMAKIALVEEGFYDPFYAAKLQTARVLLRQVLPEIESCAITARAGLFEAVDGDGTGAGLIPGWQGGEPVSGRLAGVICRTTLVFRRRQRR